MRRIALVLAGVLMLVGLTACGSSSNKTGSSGSKDTTSSMNTAAPADCPTSNEKAFAKTRFVANVGIIVGTFHHWIYKPYKAGKFQKGAKGRTFAIIKAGLAAAFIANRTNAAVKDAKASPLLCKSIAGPLSAAADKLGSLKDAIKSGNFAELTALNGVFATVTSGLAAAGLPIKEKSANVG